MGNAHLKGWPNEDQLFAMQIARIFVSIPSILGASYIVQHVLRSRKRRGRSVTRIIGSMSAHDLLLACVQSLSSSIVPRELRGWIALANGTWGTCQAVAFLQQGATISSVLYNATLTLYYLLSVRYSWNARQLRRIEPWLHAIPLFIGWGTAIAALPLNIYNPIFMGCDIVPFPMGCDSNPFVPCQRGENAHKFRTAFYFTWIWATFAFLVVAMVMIYCKIASTVRRSAGYNSAWISKTSSLISTPSSNTCERDGESSNNTPKEHAPTTTQAHVTRTRESTRSNDLSLNEMKRQFATQAFLYCMAFFMTWIFFTVELILRQLTDKPAYVPIIFLNVLLQPLQGFWNFFIYVRPRYIAYRQRERRQQEHQPQRQAGRWKAFVKSLPVDAEDYDEPSTEFKEERPNPQTHTEER